LSLLLLSVSAAPSHADGGAVEREVRQVLDAQVAAWNRRDLVGFMAGYWRSPDLTFSSGGTVTRGWEATLERYRKRYQAEGREMGRLTFEELGIEPLGEGATLGRGRWKLTLSGGKEQRGLFTLIFRKLPEGWRIIHDHSSAE
jgi:beta-aspartyl-peptidase (threonine type)